MHRIVVLALEGVIAFDLSTPFEVMGRLTDASGAPLYRIRVSGPASHVGAGPIRISIEHGLDELARADTVIVPGRADPTGPLQEEVLEALRAAARRGTRLASICVGAFDLAATGLLDGLRATTHWRAAGLLAARHPLVDVTPGALFVDNGRILTSAGATAGIDLCLHLIAQDFGAVAAVDAARTAVVPLTREAGQAQYIRDDTLGDSGLASVLQWIDENAHRAVTVADIAAVASVSTRTLHRRFLDEVHQSPSRWLARARVRIAQRLLETTDHSIDRIAADSGLGSAANLRTRFAEIVGTAPSRYRRAVTVAP